MTGGDVLQRGVLGHVGQTGAHQRGAQQGGAGIEHPLALHMNVERMPVALEFPSEEAAARKTQVDAVVRGEVLRGLRRRVSGEVGGRGNDGHAQVGADAHGDHVLLQTFAQAHPGIEALRHDVGEAVVEIDLDLQLRILGQHRLQPGPQNGVGGMPGRRDANEARRFVAQLTQGGEFAPDFLEPWRKRLQQTLAGLGRRHAARGAGEQAQAKLIFQRAHAVTQRRLRHAHLRRSASEAALARHGDESLQIVEVGRRH